MKIAIVGGNFLGCATAHYLRRALDANRGPAGGADATEADDIVIFERSPALGGHKFSVTRHGSVDVLTGSAADSDFSNTPLFNDLLSDAGIEPPQLSPRRAWAIFDWDKDTYRLASVPSVWLSALSWSPIFWVLFHVTLLISSAYFGLLIQHGRFWLIFDDVDDIYGTGIVLWFFFSVAVGFGLVPFPLVVRFYNMLLMTKLTDLSAKFAYGAAPEIAREIAQQFRDHLAAVRDADSATSAITVGHLMSCCGMAKYAKVSSSEMLEKFNVGERLRDDLISPGLCFEYADSRFTASHVSNGVAGMLSMMTRLPVPTALRAHARRLAINDTKTLCPKLASAARARLQVCTEVLAVTRDGDEKYALHTHAKSNGNSMQTGFDAVVLAAVVDPAVFEIGDGVVDTDLRQELALMEDIRQRDALATFLPNGKQKRNCAKFMTLVAGKLRASYFRRRRPNAVAASVAVLNGVDCAAVDRVTPGVYRVLSADKLDEESNLTKALFERVDRINSWKRAEGKYVATPLRSLGGRDVPAIVLSKMFLNAAATDRVANHVEMDCLSARNTASFFRDGTVTWK